VTIEALASGAADYVAKPSGQSSREAAVQVLAQDLIPKILALTTPVTPAQDSGSAQLSVFPTIPGHAAPFSRSVSQTIPHHTPAASVPPAIVLVGVSTGGPAALDVLLPAFPASFPLPILIVQHMPELFTGLLAERLNGRCPLRVREAAAGEPILPGSVHLARGDWHMEVASTGHLASAAFRQATPIIRLTREPPENHCRPAVDVLFRTAVTAYGSRVLGVVLTGMGYDGLNGSRIIREHGGTVLAQDQSTSAVWGMPGAVAQAGLANRILPLHALAPEILRLTGRAPREALELRESAV
jgi:two-component system chemotaxis response regulator CheB